MIIVWILLSVIALFLIVLVCNAVLSGTRRRKPTAPLPAVSEETEQSYARGLGRMIACATVSRKGSFDDKEFSKLRATMAELFPLLHEKAELQIFGEDCWVYRIPGKLPNRRIMLMSHHDVAEVNDAPKWAHPPFSGEIAEGKIWGRGTVDTKGPLFAEFRAVEELLQEGFVPPCDLYLASSHNEEIAGNGIPLAVQYFKEQGITFDLVLDEGGALLTAPMPGISQKCAMIAVHEKGRCMLKCKAEDAAAHAGLAASTETPVLRMSRFIAELSAKPPFCRRLYPEVRAMFTALCPYMKFPMRLIFANLWCFAPLLVKLMPKLNPQAGAMVGTLCSFPEIGGSDASHACSCDAFLRCVREEDLQQDLAAFKAIADKHGISFEQSDYEYHAPAKLDSPQLPFVQNCVAAVFPKAASSPFLLPAGTDSRHFSDLCPAVLRFAPIDLDAQQFASVHGVNENLDVKSLS
ncbi:MAG: M20/M25/M40 family metallo-hydrolase, partial [Oscillospiraceae bacterium]